MLQANQKNTTTTKKATTKPATKPATKRTTKKAVVAKATKKAATTKKATATKKVADTYTNMRLSRWGDYAYFAGLCIAFGVAKKTTKSGKLLGSITFDNDNRSLSIAGLKGTRYLYSDNVQGNCDLPALLFTTVVRQANSVTIEFNKHSTILADALWPMQAHTCDKGLIKGNFVSRVTKHLVLCGMHSNGSQGAAAGVGWPSRSADYIKQTLNIDPTHSTIIGKGRSKIWRLVIK